jgi:hypothetical protein
VSVSGKTGGSDFAEAEAEIVLRTFLFSALACG